MPTVPAFLCPLPLPTPCHWYWHARSWPLFASQTLLPDSANVKFPNTPSSVVPQCLGTNYSLSLKIVFLPHMTWLRFFRKASIPCLLLFNWKERPGEERFLFFSFFLLGKQTWDARNIDAPLGDQWGQTSGFRVQVLLMQPHASSRGRVKVPPGCKSAQYSCKSRLLRLVWPEAPAWLIHDSGNPEVWALHTYLHFSLLLCLSA